MGIDGNLKKSKYEIMAILREELRVKSQLDFSYNDMKWRTSLQKVKGTYFYVNIPPPIRNNFPQRAGFNFLIHSKLGKVEFVTYQGKFDSDSNWCFLIPDDISVLQRRLSPRFRVDNKLQFYCTGRFKDGTYYEYHLNDISEGGCSFIAPDNRLNFLSKGSLLYNVKIVLSDYGCLTLNLKIVDVVEQRIDINKEQFEIKNYRISCMFIHKSINHKERLDKILFNFIIDSKNKNRYFI
ncbi:PilZ domain-containing protein [Citrobacter amalonaticus]|uniref:flagellar brake protein n=1 Tax=Citrobacter amalonaticus TaxID=35703 RepID=UPI00292AA282|nr:PilZ domain-containing protein [Citrobacter amalonaticus]MDV0787620.1 PilZ domain-containing protein [Citrobacter amalonaticus]MEB0643684.1 PilZ domain-containing protein [Citrobacter amalonaticus]